MYPQTYLPSLLAILSLSTTSFAQIAAGGGAPVEAAPSQYPVVSALQSIVTVGGSTKVVDIVFTQTFAKTALGTWEIGATPLVGTIGLGNIQGTVGSVHAKRAVETGI